MFYNFFPPENRSVYEIIWKKYGGARGATNDVTLWRIRVECCIRRATRTHAPGQQRARAHTDKYVILIAFTQQNDSRKRLNVTLYVHFHSLLG
jgi:hypothetical protein